MVPKIYQSISSGNVNKSPRIHLQGLLKNMKFFDQKIKQLSTDLNKFICKSMNIYAFVEGLPIDNKWVRFSSKHIDSLTTFHS